MRPAALAGFAGQSKATALLAISLSGARSRGQPMDHVLLSGPPGLGKTTLAAIVASEAGGAFRPLSAPAVGKPGDLAAVLVSLRRGDVLFLDEIHRLPVAAAELLYGAMEDFRLDLLAGPEGAAQAVSIPLPPFTLIGASTRPGALPRPLRDRFGLDVRLEPYGVDDLADVAVRSAGILGLAICPAVARQAALRGRGTPRLVNRLLRRLRDWTAHHGREADLPGALECFEWMEVDADGLDGRDRRYLAELRMRGRPVGVATLATVLGEDPGTVEDEIEPWLIASGLVDRTPQGRVLGPAGVATPDADVRPETFRKALHVGRGRS